MALDKDPAEYGGVPDTTPSAPNAPYHYRMDGKPPKRTSKALVVGLIVGGVVCLVALAAAIFAITFSIMGQTVNVPAYEIGGDSIPSLYAAVGKRGINGLQMSTTNDVQTNTYRFRTVAPKEDAQAYRDLLNDHEEYLFTTDDTQADTGHFQAYKESPTEAGVILILDFYWKSEELTVILRRGPEAGFSRES